MTGVGGGATPEVDEVSGAAIGAEGVLSGGVDAGRYAQNAAAANAPREDAHGDGR